MQKKVVIAEDMVPILEYIAKIVDDSEEFSVIDKVSDGSKLINSVKQTVPDLIITDIDMPILNGFEALEQINMLESKSIEYVVITGNITAEILDKCNKLGVSRVITKPITDDKRFIKDLVEVVNTPIQENNREEVVEEKKEI